MTFPDRFNAWFHPIMIKRVAKFYNKKMALIEKQRPDLFKPVDAEVTRKHLALWGRLGLSAGDRWLRFLSNVSGIIDYTYCPDDMYYAVIERVINTSDWGVGGMSDKNTMALYVAAEDSPHNYLRYMRGRFCDQEYRTLSEKDVADILSADHGDLIGKVVDASGGKGVTAYRFENGRYVTKNGEVLTADRIRGFGSSYMLQERIQQCAFSAQFNPASCNTCRIITFRRPWDGKTRVAAAGMRFGVSDAVIDNMSQGGMCVAVSARGELGRIAATNWYKGEPVMKHPGSGIVFGGQVHPYFKKMDELACKYAEKNPYMNILSWDMIADKDGKIKILEVNPAGQGIDWPQFDFGSLFGEDTEELVDWCVRHQDLNRYAHFRTWY